VTSKLSERLYVAPAGVWVSAALFERFCAVAMTTLADGGEHVGAQLRKATDAAGSGATNFGTATTTTLPGTSPAANDTIIAAHDGKADELGVDGSGVQYTHVSALALSAVSPEGGVAVLVCGDARFSSDTLAGLGFAGL
jgi:hypothetical protein